MSGKRFVLILILLILAGGIVFGVVSLVRSHREQELRNHAADLYRKGQYEEAISLLEPFDDVNAETWKRLCREQITDREVRVLLDAGKPGEALELLYSGHPESELIHQVILARAKELVSLNQAKEALALMQSVEPVSGDFEAYLKVCEAETEAARFFDLTDAGKTEEAETLFTTLCETYTRDELSGERRTEMGLALKKSRAAGCLADGNYMQAFSDYSDLADEAGMASALDAMEQAGEYARAFESALRMENPDMERLNRLYDRLQETGYEVFDAKYGYIRLKFGRLCELKDGEARALAEKIIGGIAGECRKLIADGKRGIPYDVLKKLKSMSGPLWTDELQELADSCLEKPPENYVIRGSELLAVKGAEITVYNKRDVYILFGLRQMTAPDSISLESTPTGKSIAVFVKPRSHYTFVIASDYYEPYALMGHEWFGTQDLLGRNPTSCDVDISQRSQAYDYKNRNYLQGSYSVTFE